MKSRKKILIGAAIMLVLPVLTVKANVIPPAPTSATISSLSVFFNDVLSLIWPVAAGLSAVMAVVAGIMLITAQGEPEKIRAGRSALIWAIIGFVVAIVAYSMPTIVSNAI